MKYLMRHEAKAWRQQFRAVDENEETRFVVGDPSVARALMLRTIALASVVSVWTVWVLELWGGISPMWLFLALIALGAVEALVRLRLTLTIEDERGRHLGRLQAWWPWRRWKLSGGGGPEGRLLRTKRGYELTWPGRPPIELSGDFEHQRYHFTQDGELRARVFNLNPEPSDSFFVEIPAGADPASLMGTAAALDLKIHSGTRRARRR